MKKDVSKAKYVDGFLVALPKSKVKEYLKLAKLSSKVWLELGAIQYCETISEDIKVPFGVNFDKVVKAKRNEVVVFSWITYPSKAVRTKVNKLAMKDPRLAMFMDPKSMPFDVKRMSYGGFKMLLNS